MKEYNLFIIKDEYIDIYKNRPLFLYDIISYLYNLKSELNYGVSLYEQICKRINIKSVEYYLSSKFIKNDTLIVLKPTRIIVKTNNLCDIKLFNLYSKSIFVCDFINNDYFWLDGNLLFLEKLYKK